MSIWESAKVRSVFAWGTLAAAHVLGTTAVWAANGTDCARPVYFSVLNGPTEFVSEDLLKSVLDGSEVLPSLLSSHGRAEIEEELIRRAIEASMEKTTYSIRQNRDGLRHEGAKLDASGVPIVGSEYGTVVLGTNVQTIRGWSPSRARRLDASIVGTPMTLLVFEVDRVLQDRFASLTEDRVPPLSEGSLAAVFLPGGELALPGLEVSVEAPSFLSGSDWVHAAGLLVAGPDRRMPARILTECGQTLDVWYLSTEYLGRVADGRSVELVLPTRDRPKVARPFPLADLSLGDSSAPEAK